MRAGHYAILAAVWAALTLPNLGAPALWDMDEGVNAGCTREMLEGGSWVVPTFNWELRTAKPVLTYWLQRLSFQAFGVNEWAARFPSAVLGLGTVLVTYEIGRRMFGAATGLLGGVVLASAMQFCVLSHAATPDAPLIFLTTLTLYLFWVGHDNGGRGWCVWPAAACGLAVLAKGPIGLALPGLVVLLYFAWNRELRRVLDHRLLWGVLIWDAVTLPWYVLVTAETRGVYAERFLGYENFDRFGRAMEGHSGPPVYYVAALVVLFAPWSCFLGATLWYAVKGARTASPPERPPVATGGRFRPHRFLLCWFGAYFVFFSFAATKLPNYIAPLYPAIALLTAHFLVRWRAGELNPRRWLMPVGVAGVALTGVLVAGGLLYASGVFGQGGRVFPGLEAWAWVGAVPFASAGAMAWFLRTGNRPAFVTALAAGCVAFVGVVAAGPPLVIDRYKAAKPLVFESGAHQPERDIRLAAYGYFQESVVFYAERRVEKVYSAEAAAAFLALPRPGYLFVPADVWEAEVRPRVAVPVRVTARRYDYHKNADIIVVTNEP